MMRFSSSIWNVLWILGVPGIVMAGRVLLIAWKKRQWFHFFDPKDNTVFPMETGDFKHHWKRYEGLAKLSITLAVGAVAFLINLLVNQNNSPNEFGRKIGQVAPLVIGFFGASIFLLMLFLLWMTYCYEEYTHSLKHDSYRAWKYALTQSLGGMGFIAFLLGFVWLVSYVFGHGAPVDQIAQSRSDSHIVVTQVTSSTAQVLPSTTAFAVKSLPPDTSQSLIMWFFLIGRLRLLLGDWLSLHFSWSSLLSSL